MVFDPKRDIIILMLSLGCLWMGLAWFDARREANRTFDQWSQFVEITASCLADSAPKIETLRQELFSLLSAPHDNSPPR